MKRIYTLLFFVALCNVSIFSQPNFNWAKRISGGSVLQPSAIGVDASGNVYTVGSFTGTVDFDPGIPTFTLTDGGSGDIYITKFDAFGNFVWAKKIGGSCNDVGTGIAVDPSGIVYVTGYFCGLIDADPGPATANLFAMNTDCFVCKLNAAGNYVWSAQLSGSGMEYSYGLSLDASGNVFTTGAFSNAVDFDPGPGTYTLLPNGAIDIFVSKITSAGAFVWASAMGGAGNDYGYGISVDATGNVFTTGTFSSTADFDPGVGTYTMTSTGNNDIFVSKLDVNGAFVWAKQMGGTVNDIGAAIKADATGNVLTTGSFNGTGDFDPGVGTLNLTSLGNNDVFISKLNASGTLVWAKQIGGNSVDGGNGISTDAAGNVYTTGYYSNTADFDPGPSVSNSTSAGLADFFISKLDAAGNFAWAVQMGNTGGEYSNSIAVDANLFIYTTGNFQNTVDFDPGAGISNLTSAGSSDVFVHKLASCTLTPVQPTSISGSTLLCAYPAALNYSVAPIGGVLGYIWTLPNGWTGSNNTNSIGATPGISGVFSVAATNSCGTGPVQTLSVTVNALPSITITPFIGTVCIGGSVLLTGTGANSYTWNPGPASTTLLVTPTITTTYSVNGTGAAGCTNTAVRMVTVYPVPTVTAATNTSLLCSGASATLTAGGANNYNWVPAGTGATFVVSPTVTTTYTLTGTTVAGCSNTTTITQSVTSCVGLAELNTESEDFIVYPNPSSGIFTVYFKPQLLLTPNGHCIEIYNHVGALILSSKTLNIKTEIELNSVPNGIYFMKMISSDGFKISKLIKE